MRGPHFEKDLAHRGVNLGREIALTRVGLGVTGVAALLLGLEVGRFSLEAIRAGDLRSLAVQLGFLTIVVLLIFGNLAYQICRIGYFQRLRSHRPLSQSRLDERIEESTSRIVALIPSYKEEERVILQSLWSVALQQYPGMRAVLLIDDPPNPVDPCAQAALAVARTLPGRVRAEIREPLVRVRRDFESFETRAASSFDPDAERLLLADVYDAIAAWLERRLESHPIVDHSDAFFVQRIFGEPAKEHRRRARALRAPGQGSGFDERSCRAQYRRLAATFDTELTHFERKLRSDLSHEANKAMNLNGYIGLLGREFPDADYLVTLDADSILPPDYTPRLVEILERPGNERVAVVQTPYSAFPGAPGVLERAAGATTDMQYVSHQGFTRFDATFWVGANAVLRTVALRDIATTTFEDGIEVTRFISDTTVIEDTESSVDLVLRGWTLFNYPERLSYSATPGDFGSLLIQRRRWANGGLLILPKLFRYLLGGPGRIGRLAEGFVRFQYLGSIAAVNVAVPMLMVLPFEQNLRSAWLPLTALPYFYLYGRDMVLTGYRWTDLARVYALNLMLIPINLGGVLRSLHQALTGKKSPFKRTPKVSGLTTAPRLYVWSEILILVYCLVLVVLDLQAERWIHAVFALVNGGFFAYAIDRYVHPLESLGFGGTSPPRPKKTDPTGPATDGVTGGLRPATASANRERSRSS